MRITILLTAGALATLAFAASAAQPQGKSVSAAYPVRPIRVIQPAPPGGASDVVLRAVAQKLSEAVGQPVVVDNRPGAHGLIGNGLAARAPADGHTLLYGTVGTLAINSGLYRKLPYRMPEDFTPITQCVEQANLVLVTATLPAKSLRELVELAKARPGELSFSSAGSGSATHLGPEMFRARAGIDIKHVPYKGAAAAAVALAGGEVQVLFVSPVTATPFIRTGRIRALAVSTASRIPQMPDVPTIAESGYPGFSYGAWSGMLAPARTPRPVVEKLHGQLVALLTSRELAEIIARDGAKAVSSATPEAFGQLIRSEIARWSKIVEQTGARVE
jgi:tripartite-type tricarboxylate transporter receptor subunit TctC